jgi:hypothetical protein
MYLPVTEVVVLRSCKSEFSSGDNSTVAPSIGAPVCASVTLPDSVPA